MKTHFAKCVAFAMLMIAGLCAKAQISNPYPFTNNSSCQVNITYQAIDANCSPVGSPVSTTIGSGNTSNLSLPASACGVEIVVNWVSNSSCPATQMFSPVAAFGCAPPCAPPQQTGSPVTNTCSCTSGRIQLNNLSGDFQ